MRLNAFHFIGESLCKSILVPLKKRGWIIHYPPLFIRVPCPRDFKNRGASLKCGPVLNYTTRACKLDFLPLGRGKLRGILLLIWTRTKWAMATGSELNNWFGEPFFPSISWSYQRHIFALAVYLVPQFCWEHKIRFGPRSRMDVKLLFLLTEIAWN